MAATHETTGGAAPLRDAFGRVHGRLRISVTDRCNLRCTYCRPLAAGPAPGPAGAVLSFAEIVRLARILARAGVSRLRLTGGEPLLRDGLPDLAADLARIPGIRRLGLTTNGLLLREHAAALRRAGVAAVHVSLDSLRPDRFRQIAGGDGPAAVLEGLEAALAAGFPAVKINTVVMAGVNEGEAADFVELARARPLEVRFIEHMPYPAGRGAPSLLVPWHALYRRLAAQFPLRPLPADDPAAVVRVYAIPGFAGRVGFIAPMSDAFCDTCARLRLTADGALRTCLFHGAETDLRGALRGGETDAQLEARVRAALLGKPAGHAEAAAADGRAPRAMTAIGG